MFGAGLGRLVLVAVIVGRNIIDFPKNDDGPMLVFADVAATLICLPKTNLKARIIRNRSYAVWQRP